MKFLKDSFATVFLVDITSDFNRIRDDINFNYFLAATKKFLVKNTIGKFEITSLALEEERVFINVTLRENFKYKTNGLKFQRRLNKKLRTVKKWFRDHEGPHVLFDD